MFKKKQKSFIYPNLASETYGWAKGGFTLVGLLVVIAVITILASIVIIAATSFRNKGKDGRITVQMDQIKKAAGIIFSEQGNYSSPVSVSCSTTNPNIDTLCTDINTYAPATVNLFSSATTYCGYAQLNSLMGGSTSYYCIDYTGISKKTTTNPGGVSGQCKTGGTYVCP